MRLYPGEVVSWCIAFLQAYRSAQLTSLLMTGSVLPSQLLPPSTGLIKINFDAAFPSGETHQIAVVARDKNGLCLGCAV